MFLVETQSGLMHDRILHQKSTMAIVKITELIQPTRKHKDSVGDYYTIIVHDKTVTCVGSTALLVAAPATANPIEFPHTFS